MDATFDQRRYLIPFRSTLLPQIFTGTLVIGDFSHTATVRVAANPSSGTGFNNWTTSAQPVIVNAFVDLLAGTSGNATRH